MQIYLQISESDFSSFANWPWQSKTEGPQKRANVVLRSLYERRNVAY